MRSKVTDDQVTQAILIKYYDPQASFAKIGSSIHVTKDALQKRTKRLSHPYDPQPLPPELEEEGDFVVLADIHANFVHWDVIRKAVELGSRFAIKRCIIAGDALNADALGRFPGLYYTAPVKHELECLKEVFDTLFSHFREISLCRGNHDFRVSKATFGQFDFSSFLEHIAPKKASRVTTTDYDRIWVKTSSGKWLIAHPDTYSRDPLKTARTLSSKYDCHVLTAHEHHGAVGISDNGRHIVGSLPCACTEPPYKAMNSNAMPNWVMGCGVLWKGLYMPYYHGHPVGVK